MDSAVFDSVWLPHQAAFYRLAFYILENEDEARDAVQDLYLKLWDMREQLDSIDNPKAYGLHLLRNRCIDRIRSRTRHRQTALDELSAGTEESPEEGLGRREEILLAPSTTARFNACVLQNSLTLSNTPCCCIALSAICGKKRKSIPVSTLIWSVNGRTLYRFV